MSKLGQEPAFPSKHVAKRTDYSDGMSKRFYAACAAMRGMLAYRGAYYQSAQHNDPSENLGGETPEWCAKVAYQFADELLKQEGEG